MHIFYSTLFLMSYHGFPRLFCSGFLFLFFSFLFFCFFAFFLSFFSYAYPCPLFAFFLSSLLSLFSPFRFFPPSLPPCRPPAAAADSTTAQGPPWRASRRTYLYHPSVVKAVVCSLVLNETTPEPYRAPTPQTTTPHLSTRPTDPPYRQ